MIVLIKALIIVSSVVYMLAALIVKNKMVLAIITILFILALMFLVPELSRRNLLETLAVQTL